MILVFSFYFLLVFNDKTENIQEVTSKALIHVNMEKFFLEMKFYFALTNFSSNLL